MQQIVRAFPLLALLALAGCGTTGSVVEEGGYYLPGPQTAGLQQPSGPPPSETVNASRSMTDITAFVDPSALKLMSAADKTQASAAQFNALQFSRAGAPRAWSGSGGMTGSVLVGPPVNVNALYCREFTHTVTVGGQTYTKKALACRDAGNIWSVEGA